MFRTRTVVAVLALCMVCGTAFADVSDGGFEGGNTNGWTKWAASWSSPDVLTSVAETQAAYSGTYGMRLTIGGFSSCGVYQTVNVTPGVRYRLEGMYKGVQTSDAWVEAMILDGAFSVLAADDPPACRLNVAAGYDGGAGFPAPVTGWDWEPFSATYANWSFGDGARVATGNTLTVVLKVGGTNTNVYFDDVHLVPVPEPSSLLALGTGLFGLAGFVIRRKR